jgi:ubiquinone biosynthesis protein COQ9
MQIEKVKAGLRDNPLGKAVMAGPQARVFGGIRMPMPDDLPGSMGRTGR